MTRQLQVHGATPATLDVDGHRLAALQAGRAAAPPVLLIPGYTGSKEDFAPLLEPLGAAGLRVTAVDLPGQYQSPGLPAAADYTPAGLAGIVTALAAALGPDLRLLGHSFGGLVARAAVLADPAGPAEPGRFASLVLMSSGPAGIGGRRRALMDALEPVLADGGVAAVHAATSAAEASDPSFVPPPPELAAFLKKRFLAGSPTMLQGMADALRDEPDRVAELAAVGLPTLVVHGVDDDAWPPPVQRAMADRLTASYVVIPGAVHSPAVENPAATVAALLDFWRP